MLHKLMQIPYVKDLVKHLRRKLYLRDVCGYGDRAPCEAQFSQMKRRIGAARAGANSHEKSPALDSVPDLPDNQDENSGL